MVKSTGTRVPLIVVVIQLGIRSSLFEFFQKFPVPSGPDQFDITGLGGRTHAERTGIFAAGRVFHLNVKTEERSAPLYIDKRHSRCSGLLLQENYCAPTCSFIVHFCGLLLELLDVQRTALNS